MYHYLLSPDDDCNIELFQKQSGRNFKITPERGLRGVTSYIPFPIDFGCTVSKVFSFENLCNDS